jgi:hypothetical protein
VDNGRKSVTATALSVVKRVPIDFANSKGTGR